MNTRKRRWRRNIIFNQPNWPRVGFYTTEGHGWRCWYFNLFRTDEAFRNFITTLWAPDASPDELADLWTNYTSTPADGSPFATGDFNQLYPQFKRLAAFQGDLVFQAPRRHFIKHLSGVQKIWTYRKCFHLFIYSPYISELKYSEQGVKANALPWSGQYTSFAEVRPECLLMQPFSITQATSMLI